MIEVTFDQMIGTVRQLVMLDVPGVPRAGDLVDLSTFGPGIELSGQFVIRGTVSHVTWRPGSVFVTLISRPLP